MSPRSGVRLHSSSRFRGRARVEVFSTVRTTNSPQFGSGLARTYANRREDSKSQRFQIFEQFLFVLVRQLRAVGVALIAVSFFSRIEKKIRLR
jgi:hypothetical protein